jgi:hypothetical protein
MTKVDLQAKVDNLRQDIDFYTTLYQAVSPLISARLLKWRVLKPNPTIL